MPTNRQQSERAVIVEQRFEKIEHQLQLQRRLQGKHQRRLVERMERMEQGMSEVLLLFSHVEEKEKKEKEKKEKNEKEKEKKDAEEDNVLLDASLETAALLTESVVLEDNNNTCNSNSLNNVRYSTSGSNVVTTNLQSLSAWLTESKANALYNLKSGCMRWHGKLVLK